MGQKTSYIIFVILTLTLSGHVFSVHNTIQYKSVVNSVEKKHWCSKRSIEYIYIEKIYMYSMDLFFALRATDQTSTNSIVLE